MIVHYDSLRITTMDKLNDIIKYVQSYKPKYGFINKDNILNVYHFGSWAFGTNTPTSDRDLLFVIDTDKSFITFKKDGHYHHYVLITIDLPTIGKFDVILYSKADFEKLLEIHFMIPIECIFLRDEFVWKNTVDYKQIYLEK